MGKRKKVSLEELPDDKPFVLTSPRSVEACRRLGVDPAELSRKPLESFAEKNRPTEVARLRYEYHEQQRQELLNDLRKERANVITEIESGVKGAIYQPDLSIEDVATAVEKEQRRVEAIKRRQRQEIEQMLAFELKMEQLMEENNRKLEQEAERQERIRQQRIRSKQEWDRAKHEKELQKKMEDEAAERKRREIQTRMFEEEAKRARVLERKQREIERQAAQAEMERRQKQLELRQKTQELMKSQIDEIVHKASIRDKQEEERRRRADEQARERLEEKRQRIEMQKMRIKATMDMNADIAQRQREEFERREMMTEAKRQEYEQKKQQEIELRRRQNEEKELQRALVLEEARREEAQRVSKFLEKKAHQDDYISQVSQRRELIRQLKQEEKRLKIEAKLKQVERQRRIDEYNRQKQLRDIQAAAMRIDRMNSQKGQLIEQRKQAQAMTQKQKEDVITAFEKIRITKNWDKLGDALKGLGGSVNLDVSQLSVHSTDRPQSAPATARRRPQKRLSSPINRGKTPTTASSSPRAGKRQL